MLVAETDYVLTIPRVVVHAFQGRLRLEIVKLPLVLPQFTIALASHRRHAENAEHRWMRDLLVRAMRAWSGLPRD